MNFSLREFAPPSVPVVHPGEVLAEKMEEMGMGFREMALRAARPEKTIAAVLRGDSSITPDMALAFEFATGIPAKYWTDHQRGYDAHRAWLRLEARSQEADASWTQQFPIAEMQTLGWLPAGDVAPEDLLRFFGFAEIGSWKAYFLDGRLKGAFGISLEGHPEREALSVWFRAGELRFLERASRVQAFSSVSFKRSAWREVFASSVDFAGFARASAALGVAVEVTPCLPGLSTSLVTTRWIQRRPLIQVTPRVAESVVEHSGVLSHAVGHCALHGKKGVFAEDAAGRAWDRSKEAEADGFLSGGLNPVRS